MTSLLCQQMIFVMAAGILKEVIKVSVVHTSSSVPKLDLIFQEPWRDRTNASGII